MANALEILKQDHRTVEGLFTQFESSQERSVAEQICEELDTHTKIEEQIVYPVLRSDVSGGEGMAEHAEGEHAEARQLIGRIRQTKDDDHLAELVGQLKAAIEEHVSDEEDEVFPKMEQALEGSRLQEMGDEVESMKG